MEGLEFVPSESVWANIQNAVAGRRRRRGGFYFWRLALPAVLLTGIVGVWYFAAEPARTPVATRSAVPASPNAAPASPAVKPDVLSSAAAKPDASRVATVVSSDQDRTAQQQTFRRRQKDASQWEASRQKYASRQYASRQSASRLDASTGDAGDNHFAGAAEHPGKAVETSDATDGLTGAGEAQTQGPAAIAPYFYQPALAGQRNAGAIKAAHLAAKKNIISLDKLQKVKRPWEAGFVAGGGISRLNRLEISPAAQNTALSINLYNITSANGVQNKNRVSDVRADASFMAGIYLQKPLSRRWTVNLGMNLHYYSTRITIGDPVNTYVPVSASLIAPTTLPAAQSSTAFIAGDREVFTNHYYFLELPVNIRYQLTKSRLLPVFLEGGFSLSRLVGSDALSYNAHSGVYYKDPSALEKTQFNVSSAVMVGLPFHGIRIQAGPQVEYGLTPLINNQNQGDQHFFYGGLRVVIIPVRK